MRKRASICVPSGKACDRVYDHSPACARSEATSENAHVGTRMGAHMWTPWPTS